MPFLERTGGVAMDLPGFGRSAKPADFDYSIDGLRAPGSTRSATHARAGSATGLLVHDWGSVGLAMAQREPERLERLVVINAVPFLPGYSWHRFARIWRTPLLGELFQGRRRGGASSGSLPGHARATSSTRSGSTTTTAPSARS